MLCWQGDRTGRLLKYDPSTQKISFIAGGLYYSNGVALAPDDSYVLVTETATLKVLRYWLQGPRVWHYSPSCHSCPHRVHSTNSAVGEGLACLRLTHELTDPQSAEWEE